MRQVLFFHADYCGLCRVLQNTLIKQLKDKRVKVTSIDVMKYPNQARFYQVHKLPTTIVLDHDGEVYSRFEGYADLELVNGALYDREKTKLKGDYPGEGSINKLA